MLNLSKNKRIPVIQLDQLPNFQVEGPGPVIQPGQPQNLQGQGPDSLIQPSQLQNFQGQGPGPVIQPGQLPNFPWQWPVPVIPPWLIPNLPGNQQRLDVRIKSVFADQYVNVAGNNFLHANISNANIAPVFRVIFIDRNRFRLRIQGGNFIRVNNNDFLVADTNNRGASIFILFRTGNREFAIMAPNGNYIRVRESDNRLVARAENAGPRTRFRFRDI